MKRVLLVLCVLFAMACNKGGGSGSGGSNGTPSTPPLEVQVSGMVVHSEISAADIVFFDRNGNKSLDADEPQATINQDGSYTITGSTTDATTVPLVAHLANSGANPSAYAAYPMANAPMIFETPAGQRTISSLTTVVKALMDSDPTVSMDDANDEVQSTFGVDAFDTATLVQANKVTAVMDALAQVLSGFGISLSDKAMMLIMSEVTAQLSAINSGSGIDDDFGGANQSDIEDELDKIEANMPTTMTATQMMEQGLSGYWFRTTYDSIPEFDYLVFNNSSLTLYRGNINTLPNTSFPSETNAAIVVYADGSASFGDINISFFNATKFNIGGKTLNAGPKFGSQNVSFPAGSIMYKLLAEGIYTYVNMEMINDKFDDNGNFSCNNNPWPCNAASVNSNQITTSYHETQLTINMSNGKYNVTSSNKMYVDPFMPAYTLPSGTYKMVKDGGGYDAYEFANAAGKVMFTVFPTYDGWQIAGNYLNTSEFFLLFNETAANAIKDNWQ